MNDLSGTHRACLYDLVNHGQCMIRRKVCEVPSVASVILRPSMYLSIGMGLNRGNNCMDGLHFVKGDDVTFGFTRPRLFVKP